MLRSSLFLVLCSLFALSIVTSGFEDDDFERQFEAEVKGQKQPTLKTEVGQKVEEVGFKVEEKDEDGLEDEYDDEEFVSSKKGSLKAHRPFNGQQQQQQQEQEQQQQKQQQQASPYLQHQKIQKLSADEMFQNFIPDFCIIGVIVLYVLYYFVGRSQNRAIANAFGEEYGDLFREAFLYLGVGGDTLRRCDTIKNNTDMIAHLSATEHAILGTGHKHCAGILATLVLKSRQDIFSVAYNYYTKERDDLMIEVPMNTLDTMNCLVVRKDNKDAYEPTYGDSLAANEPIESSNFGKEFCLVSDCDRHVFAAIFSNRDVAATLRKYAPLIKSIHFTDQKKSSTHSKCLRFVFVMPTDVTKMRTLLKMTLFLIDFLAQYKHSPKARQVVETNRLKISQGDKREKRQEELQQKRDKEWSSMTEDQRKKKLEREKMRKLKKRAGQMKVQM